MKIIKRPEELQKIIEGLKKNPVATNPAAKSSMANAIKESSTASSSGIKGQTRYALTGAEHYDDLKHVFGADNVKWDKLSTEIKTNNISIGQKYVNIHNVHDFIHRMPENATRLPWKEVPGGAEQGIKYAWIDEFGNKFQARAHSLDYSAPSGTNASEGWIYRIEMKPGGSGKWHPMDSKGIFHKPNEVKSSSPMYNADIANDTHIKFTKTIK